MRKHLNAVKLREACWGVGEKRGVDGEGLIVGDFCL